MPNKELLLIDVPVGHHATIAGNIGNTVDSSLDRRMRELGLRAGAEVTVMQKTAGGGRVVKIRGGHYALCANTLKRIVVELGTAPAPRARRA